MLDLESSENGQFTINKPDEVLLDCSQNLYIIQKSTIKKSHSTRRWAVTRSHLREMRYYKWDYMFEGIQWRYAIFIIFYSESSLMASLSNSKSRIKVYKELLYTPTLICDTEYASEKLS